MPEMVNFENIAFSPLAIHVATLFLQQRLIPDIQCDHCLGVTVNKRELMIERFKRSMKRLKHLSSVSIQDYPEDKFCGDDYLEGASLPDMAEALFHGPREQPLESLTLNVHSVHEIEYFRAHLNNSQLESILHATKSLYISTYMARYTKTPEKVWNASSLGVALKRAARDVEHLTLQFEDYDMKLFAYKPPQFGNLKTLHLTGFVMNVWTFRKAIQVCYHSLTSLQIHCISAYHGRWQQIFQDLKEAKQLEELSILALDYMKRDRYVEGRWVWRKSWGRIVTKYHGDLHSCRDLLMLVDTRRKALGMPVYKRGNGQLTEDRLTEDQYHWVYELSSMEDWRKYGKKKRWNDGEKRKEVENFLKRQLWRLGTEIIW